MFWLIFIGCSLVVSNALHLQKAHPAELKDVTYRLDEENLVRSFHHHLKHAAKKTSGTKRYELHSVTGSNCGSTKLPITINDLELPDVIILGDDTTVSANVTVSKEIKDISLITVVVQKEGLPIDIPCMDNIGTCNYTQPCEMLKKFECPPEVIKQGWDCRCPLKAMNFVLPKTTVAVPTIPLPAFLVNGKYNVQVRMFDDSGELLCYKTQVTLKVKE